MYFFCLLWIPLFYLFWRSVTGAGVAGGVWALILGSVMAVARYFAGDFIEPGGFGAARWMSGLVDIVALPVIAPVVVYALCVFLRFFSGAVDFTGFALLWLIPAGVSGALMWGSGRSLVLLVLVPLLWSALAAGVPFFIKQVARVSRWYLIVLMGLGILVLPALAVTVYWAFFSQRNVLGFVLFFVVMTPLIISVVDSARAR